MLALFTGKTVNKDTVSEKLTRRFNQRMPAGSASSLVMFNPDTRQLRSPRSRMRLVQIQTDFIFLNLKNKDSRF